MSEPNPYRPPQATVEDPRAPDVALAAEPRQVDAGRGLSWLVEGWTLFRQAPGPWIALTVVGALVFIVLALVPLLGHVATTLLSVLFGGGIMIGCRALDRGGDLTVGHLFAGFQSHLGPLLVIGALYLGGTILMMLIASLVAGGGWGMAALWGDPVAAGGAVAIGALVFLLLLIPLAMAMWFAPALATLHDVAPVEAIRLSFVGCLRNALAFLVYGVLMFILSILASIPFGLGWLVALPIIGGSIYAGYKDIFLQH